jgi:hypothetical protein
MGRSEKRTTCKKKARATAKGEVEGLCKVVAFHVGAAGLISLTMQ